MLFLKPNCPDSEPPGLSERDIQRVARRAILQSACWLATRLATWMATRYAPRFALTATRFKTIATCLLLVSLAFLGGCASQLHSVVLRVNHRIYTKFDEVQEVRPGEEFQIGDTDFSARIVDFVPDFAIEGQSGKVFSRSDQPNNPAIQIEIYEDGQKLETTWAFARGRGAPHYSREAMLLFIVEDFIWNQHGAGTGTRAGAGTDTESDVEADPEADTETDTETETENDTNNGNKNENGNDSHSDGESESESQNQTPEDTGAPKRG